MKLIIGSSETYGYSQDWERKNVSLYCYQGRAEGANKATARASKECNFKKYISLKSFLLATSTCCMDLNGFNLSSFGRPI